MHAVALILKHPWEREHFPAAMFALPDVHGTGYDDEVAAADTEAAEIQPRRRELLNRSTAGSRIEIALAVEGEAVADRRSERPEILACGRELLHEASAGIVPVGNVEIAAGIESKSF